MTYLDDIRWKKEVEHAHPPLVYDHFVSAVLFDLSGIANELDKIPRLARIVATCQVAMRKWDADTEIDPEDSEFRGYPTAYQLIWAFTQEKDPRPDPQFDDWYTLGCAAAGWLDQLIRDGVKR